MSEKNSVLTTAMNSVKEKAEAVTKTQEKTTEDKKARAQRALKNVGTYALIVVTAAVVAKTVAQKQQEKTEETPQD